jgi:hypothetical protein
MRGGLTPFPFPGRRGLYPADFVAVAVAGHVNDHADDHANDHANDHADGRVGSFL